MTNREQLLLALFALGATSVAACNKGSGDVGTVKTSSNGGVETAPSAQAVDKRNHALVRVVDAVPGLASITVYAGDSVAFPAVPYRTVSDFREMGDDLFAFKVVPVGGNKDNPAAENHEKLADGGHYTVIAFADAGGNGKMNLRVLNDELKPMTNGKARVRMINALANSDEVSMGLGTNDTKLFDDVNFKREAGWKEVDPMSGTLTFTTEKGKRLASKPGMTLAAGKSYTFVVTGRNDKADIITFEDDVAMAPSKP